MSQNLNSEATRKSFVHADNDHDGLKAFLAIRQTLYGIARRMLRDVSEAEDIIQNVWLRWNETDRTRIADPAAFLATITRRLCLNVLSSSRKKRETLVGEWTIEPVTQIDGPNTALSRKDTLNFAVQILLERLRPAERAAYILREAFDFSSRHIAEVLQVNEPNVRQLLTRSRSHLRAGCRQAATALHQHCLFISIWNVLETGDVGELERILATDVSRGTSQPPACR